MGCPNSMPNLDELRKVTKALEDADYWGHSHSHGGSPPSSRKNSKFEDDHPVSNVLPGKLTPKSKSASKSNSKSQPTSKSKDKDKSKLTKSRSAPKSKSKLQSKSADKENQLASEF
jgi:hypothetical protein